MGSRIIEAAAALVREEKCNLFYAGHIITAHSRLVWQSVRMASILNA